MFDSNRKTYSHNSSWLALNNRRDTIIHSTQGRPYRLRRAEWRSFLKDDIFSVSFNWAGLISDSKESLSSPPILLQLDGTVWSIRRAFLLRYCGGKKPWVTERLISNNSLSQQRITQCWLEEMNSFKVVEVGSDWNELLNWRNINNFCNHMAAVEYQIVLIYVYTST